MNLKDISRQREKAAESTDYKTKQQIFKKRFVGVVYGKGGTLNKAANLKKRDHKFIIELLMRRGKPKPKEYFLNFGLSDKEADFLLRYQGQTRSMAVRLERRFFRGDYE